MSDTESPAGVRLKTPTILQMEAVECGAASLAMVLAYHGAYIPLEELRVACGVTRDGTKASNLLKAARRYGLSAKGFKKDPGRLLELPLPQIIHWNFNHFVVLEGVRDGQFYLNDPASGRRVVDAEQFDLHFTGVALAFERTDEFEPRGKPAKALGLLASQLTGSSGALSFILLASLALVLPGIVIAGFSGLFVDNLLVAGRSDWLVPLILGMSVAMILRGCLTFLQQRYLLRLESKLAMSMASRFLWKMAQLPIAFFTQRHVGDLANRMAANDRIATLLSGQLATNAMNLISVVFYAGAIALFDVWLAALALALAFCNGIGLKAVDQYREAASRSLQVAGGRVMGATVGVIRTAETIKASGLESDAFVTWSGYQARLLGAQRELGASTAVLSTFPLLLGSLSTVAILGIGGLRVMSGSLSIGDIVAIQSLMASFIKPIGGLVNLGGQLQVIKGELTRLSDIHSHHDADERGPAEGQAWEGPEMLAGRVEVRDVSFGYSPLDPPLLDNINLTLPAGARVALVGASGSGKSTLGRVIAGLQPVWDGEVSIDGCPIKAIPPHVFASSVAYVDQDVFLFEGTVRENLTLWNDVVPEAEVTRALKDALIHDEIIGRKGQYDTEVLEGGLNFSGGQRQRLELARALVNAPSLLILDEATAALDATTEKHIDDNLRRRGCACLIIAHRLSTIRDCDEIIVMQRGKIVERGTHDELIAGGELYVKLLGAGA